MTALPTSPYSGTATTSWSTITDTLLDAHPLKGPELVDVVLISWKAIFETRIGPAGFRIGTDLEPQPQIMGFLLHELIPLELQRRYPGQWRRQQTKYEKDLVYELDHTLSVELKTSSHGAQVFGNRSYGKPAKTTEIGRKGKAGYFLTVNFEKFSGPKLPEIRAVRFGWLDHDDWISQAAETGQSARLRAEAYQYKLRTLYAAGPSKES